MKLHVLDANALWRFLTDGPGANLVADLFKQARRADQNVSMSVVNWGEVYYSIMKAIGRERADEVINALDGLPLSVAAADLELTRRAADIRASHGLHYADCFAAALAGNQGIVVTSDAKDFRKVPSIQLLELPSGRR